MHPGVSGGRVVERTRVTVAFAEDITTALSTQDCRIYESMVFVLSQSSVIS